ncbi:MAG: tetratricopeptide repeat protein [Myxococcales bacterium]|nr:tetratricopeptide repeat protein [Myxococcales bacterium]
MACLPRPFALRALALLALAASQVGCVSYWKGQEMEADVVALQGQIESMREDQRKQRAATQEELQGLTSQLSTMEASLNQAIERLRTAGANSALELEKLNEEIARLKGELEEARHKAEQAKATGLPEVEAPPGAPALPDNAADLYRYGYERKQANDCPEAIRAFATFSRDYADNDRADNALYLLAECQYVRGEYTNSIRTLQVISQKYAKGDKVDDALMLMHDNFVALNRCQDALPFLETLLAEYPRSNRAKAARKKLAATKKRCK